MENTQKQITKQRHQKLQSELLKLKTFEQKLSDEAKSLAEEGKGWRFNNQLGETIDKQSEVQRKITELEAFLTKAVVIDQLSTNGEIVIGSIVEIKKEDGTKKIVTIVHEDSIDLDPKQGVISANSPLALALLEKRVGDKVIMRGIVYEILSID